MLIDTHAHLDFPEFDKDQEQVIQQARKAGIERIINVGSSLEGTKKSVELAQKYDFIYAAVGIHPHDAQDIENTKKFAETLRELAQKPKVVAIGECGLDFHPVDQGKLRKNITSAIKEKQKEVFRAQFKLAQELNLPVIIHCRSAFAKATADKDAHQEILQLIKSSIISKACCYAINHKSFPGGVFHCFSGDQDFLNQVLKMGFLIGFCGNLTFKNAKNLWEIAKITPIEKILLETDCPFLSPEPLRGLRNTPENVKLIGEFLAKLKNISFEEICQITTQNAKNLFKI